MTVAELIAELQGRPPDMEVFTHGYEGGLVPMNRVKPTLVSGPADDHRPSYFGSHDESVAGKPALILEHDGRHENSGSA
jgi:hypothetical protein